MVVSDVPLLREGVARMIERMPDARLVATVGLPTAAVDHLRHRRVDVVVVDAQMDPDFRLVRTLSAAARVFVLLRLNQSATGPSAAAAAGASGVALATTSLRVLAESLRATARSARVAAVRTDDFKARTVVELRGPGGVLSPRESEILQLMAEGLVNETIAERLFLSIDTVRTHAKNLSRKLGVRCRAQAVAYAYQSGFMSAGRAS
nr:response regulator transcription factor [Kibdelosporangium sp. MJ126-NF4]